MAATKLIAMHKNVGMTVGQCLGARLKYAEDEEKTDDERYITSYACNWKIADKEFMDFRNEYFKTRGAIQGDIIAYQIRQSFKPGEVTPEEANAIGYETAMRFTKGEHAFVCCTHVDKAHIHNHVIYSAVNLHCDKKFRDSWFCGIGLRRLSDMICLEHGLSVIEPYKNKIPKPKYDKSYRQNIRESIDTGLSQNPKTFEELLQFLEKKGYELKRGKHLAIRENGRKNFIRFKSLGDKYSVDFLKKQIEGEDGISRKKPKREFDLLIDIQEKLRQGKGKGYERWSQKYNNKAIMKTLLYLEEKGIRSYMELKDLADSTASDFKELTEKIKKVEARIEKLSEIRKQLRNYARTKDVFTEYARGGFKAKFYEAHREEITIYKAAKKAFAEYGGNIPKSKELTKEIDALMEEKKSYYRDYKLIRDDNKTLQEARRNVELFLQLHQDSREPKRQHTVVR
ncbi:MAG: relaxase/mobilization nuclease domain-containing protein [Butyrivibrio sp.]|nr:relaxase/mobilization nuclease domain-containing protein [Butyrivibrio sp.]